MIDFTKLLCELKSVSELYRLQYICSTALLSDACAVHEAYAGCLFVRSQVERMHRISVEQTLDPSQRWNEASNKYKQ